MKAPWYEIAPGATIALLLTKRFTRCTLYTIKPINGGVIRWTDGPVDVSVQGNVWKSNTPIFLPSTSTVGHWKVGMDVDTWQFSIAVRSVDELTGVAWPDKLGTFPLLPAIRSGMLDGCDVQVDRALFTDWPDPAFYPDSLSPIGVVTMFSGRMAAVDLGRTQVAFTINSYMEMFNLQMPKELWSAPCRHTLFDSGCTLVQATYGKAGTVGAGSTQSVIQSSVAAPLGSATYALGQLVFKTGANTGFSRSVRIWSSGAFTLLSPFFWDVNTGDTFVAYPGCNKTFAQCTQFGNTANYGGQRWIPAPETAI